MQDQELPMDDVQMRLPKHEDFQAIIDAHERPGIPATQVRASVPVGNFAGRYGTPLVYAIDRSCEPDASDPRDRVVFSDGHKVYFEGEPS